METFERLQERIAINREELIEVEWTIKHRTRRREFLLAEIVELEREIVGRRANEQR